MRRGSIGVRGSSGRLWAVMLAMLASACARAPRVVNTPVPIVIVPAETAFVAPIDTAPPVDTLISYRVPAFRETPLISWGAAPPGERRTERTRSYDLQHQVTRIRFDWARHAVIGSTRIRFAALDQPLTSATFDAVGMTILAVRSSSGDTLEHSYDGTTLSVTLRPALAAGAR